MGSPKTALAFADKVCNGGVDGITVQLDLGEEFGLPIGPVKRIGDGGSPVEGEGEGAHQLADAHQHRAIWLRASHWGDWVRPAGALLTSRRKDVVLGISFYEQMVERLGTRW